jgi:outer membrane protein assembly factor BamB
MLRKVPWVAAVDLLMCFAVYAGDGSGATDGAWNRFRGPDGSGISSASTVPVRWTEKDYNWKVRLPGVGHSSPVVWGNRLVVTCGDPKTAARTVVCVGAAGGKTLWRFEEPSSAPLRQHRDNSFATATPCVDADGVVALWCTAEGLVVLALDWDGRVLWRRNVGPYVGIHGSGASPIVLGDVVLVPNDQEDPKALPMVYGRLAESMPSGKSSLWGLDRKTGETRWQVERRTSQAPYSTPCVFRRADGRTDAVFTSTSHGLTAIDPSSGRIRWELADAFDQRCVGSPVATRDLVIGGNGYGLAGTHIVAVRPGDRESSRQPTVAYKLAKPVPLVPTPLVWDNRLFLWTDEGVVTCADANTGKTIWRERVGGSFYSSPVCVAGRLYCVARDGTVVVLSAGKTFEAIARVPLGEPSHATPAVAAGVMYFRTFSQLLSLGGKKR